MEICNDNNNNNKKEHIIIIGRGNILVGAQKNKENIYIVYITFLKCI